MRLRLAESLFAEVLRRAQQRAGDARRVAGVGADDDVLERGHVGEETDVLERAGDPGLGDVVRLAADERDVIEADVAARWAGTRRSRS